MPTAKYDHVYTPADSGRAEGGRDGRRLGSARLRRSCLQRSPAPPRAARGESGAAEHAGTARRHRTQAPRPSSGPVLSLAPGEKSCLSLRLRQDRSRAPQKCPCIEKKKVLVDGRGSCGSSRSLQWARTVFTGRFQRLASAESTVSRLFRGH